jgi:hypothetical protein
LLATLALANAGIIAEQPAYYSSPVKTVVSAAPVAYAADHHQYHHAAPASSYTKTISYSQPKAYIAQPALASYHSYEPEQHHYVSAYHHEPEHHVYAASPVHYEHGSSEQNIVRSAHGTVSHISKSVDTPHSSVRKYDTRVINDGYKTVQYAQPAYIQPAVVAKTVVSQPLVTKTIASPVIAKTVTHVAQPAAHYQYAAQPVQYSAAQPVHYSAPQYAAHAPVLASKVHYSPAIEVAHASFESPVAHYSW